MKSDIYTNFVPKNVAALAGIALAIAGARPGKKALMPPALYSCPITPPIVGLPGILCSLDFTVSTGKTGSHMATPAVAPAAMTAGRLNFPGSPVSGSFGVNVLLIAS
jgi:hypothetical protein